jgi:hypothetical protein
VQLTAIILIAEMCIMSPDVVSHFRRVCNVFIFYYDYTNIGLCAKSKFISFHFYFQFENHIKMDKCFFSMFLTWYVR